MKNLRKLMLLLMMVAGVNLYSQSPSMWKNGTCPAKQEHVDYTTSCCPSCPEGQVAKIEEGPVNPKISNYPSYVCACVDKADKEDKAKLYKDCYNDCESFYNKYNQYNSTKNSYNQSCDQYCSSLSPH